MSTLAQVLIRGLRSAQPVATAVAAGSLYFVTDEGVTEQSDGAAWQTYSKTGVLTNINISAAGSSANLSALVFSNSNGVTFGLNGSTLTASVGGGGGGGTINSFQNILMPFTTANLNGFTAGSRIDFVPFVLPSAGSFDYMRFLFNFTGQNFGISQTSSSTSFSIAQTHSFVQVLYSRGSGASTGSLMSIWSSVDTMVLMTSIRQSSSDSKTVSYFATYPSRGGTSSFSSSTSSGAGASYQFNSTDYAALAGAVFIEPGFSTTLPAGQYWLGMGFSSSSTKQAGAPTDSPLAPMVYTQLGVQTIQTSQWPHRMGAATNSTFFWMDGMGSYTTNVNLSLLTQPALSDIRGFSQMPYFALLKQP